MPEETTNAAKTETQAPIVDQPVQKEVARETSLSEFIDYKEKQAVKAEAASLKAVKGEVPFGTTADYLVNRALQLREQVQMLNNLVDSRASDVKDQLYPDTPFFWEMNDGEKDIIRTRVKDAPLSESATWYESVVDGFEADYKGRFQSKSYDKMKPEEESQAREDLVGLDKMHKLHEEMLNFKPQPVTNK